MNMKTILKSVVPAFGVGAIMVAFSSRSLEQEGAFAFEPNPGALAKSPYGRTVGMALQGPVNRFWDRGIGATEQRAELLEGSRPDQKLFNWVTNLREDKTEGRAPDELAETYKDHTFSLIEKKLELAWRMDPRNFGNYAIYQMFLWEGFNSEVFESQFEVRELSLATLNASLADEGSPVSLLTAAQAAYDLVFEARTSKTQDQQESYNDITTYSELLPQIVADYDSLVSGMKSDGRWADFSEVKKGEFGARRDYLGVLLDETRIVVEKLTQTEEKLKEGSQS